MPFIAHLKRHPEEVQKTKAKRESCHLGLSPSLKREFDKYKLSTFEEKFIGINFALQRAKENLQEAEVGPQAKAFSQAVDLPNENTVEKEFTIKTPKELVVIDLTTPQMAFEQLEIARQKIALSLIPPWSREDILCDRTQQTRLRSFSDGCLKSTFNSG